MNELNLHLSSIEDIKEEEKRLQQEYKEKLAELKKNSKGKRICWASIYKRIIAYICISHT